MLIDMRQMNLFFQEIDCPSCHEQGSLLFEKSDNFDRFGFAVNIMLTCQNCQMCVDKHYTSQRSGNKSGTNPFQVNDIFMLFLSEVGLGHAAMKKFCLVFGMEGLHPKTFQHKQNILSQVVVENTEEVLTQSVEIIKHAYGEQQTVSNDVPLDITVSYDGSWQKRGHTSNYGVGAVIDVLTGLVIDYEVLSKYCHACTLHINSLGQDTTEFRQWYEGHAGRCCQNYEGSSNAMEVEAAKRLWSRSLEKHNIRYTCILSDGDSKTHKAINDLQPYGPDISIDKEDCVNHAHKRMGTALLKLSKELRLGGRGKGKLTKDKALKFQYYYRFAITNNVGNIDGTRNAIWASLFHCMSTDDSPHHTRCPTGPSSWCFYNRALANDLEPPAHADNIRHFLDAEIAEKMVPVYQRMSDENLLKRMVKGKTQNANECLHSVIWSRCPKTVFVGARRLHRAVASAIASFNEGTCHITQVMNKLAIEANEITAASVERLDNVRTLKARKQSQETSKMERSAKWEAKKRDRVHVDAAEGLLYGAGEF
ncbi:uncharacterized protein LOC125376009 [Haliotis rufescens]|uniref:uncharacterized protein LOC125376009 n=1 Tax=Haliotis rufescens TaxID=6454 RepID=UPI00201F31F0|nr:uncharacterized protein LOC125376009 [Haliotis rufescens]